MSPAPCAATKGTTITATKVSANPMLVAGPGGGFASLVARRFVIVVSFVAASFMPSVAHAQTETIAEIRVHGNHTTPDAAVLALSGLKVGDAADEARLRAAEMQMRDSGRFADAEVRRRFRSISDPSDILVVILVDELTAVSEDDLTPGPLKRFWASGQWLPIFGYTDGYGLTYGARASFAGPLGERSRVSVPLSWGGERHAGLEVERTFNGPVSLVRGTVSLTRRVSPFFDVPDSRIEGQGLVERAFLPWLRAGAHARIAHVGFGVDYDRRHTAGGGYVTIDTRLDPSFPRNAIHATTGWERVGFETGSAGRWRTDARGYLGVGGSAVLALRAQLSTSSGALPAAEQALLGGSDSLRGYRAGHKAGDNLAALSAEVRLPVNSPLSVGRFGVRTFIDAGTTWASGTRLSDARVDRGIGGGVYFGAALFLMEADVAWPRKGTPRAHVGLGVRF